MVPATGSDPSLDQPTKAHRPEAGVRTSSRVVEVAAPDARRSLRMAIAHDWLVGMRGGERVLDRLAMMAWREHRPVGVFTMFDDGQPLSMCIDRLPRTVARLGRLPGVSRRYRRWLLPMYPGAARELSRRLEREHRREPIDVLVSTSSSAVKAMRAPAGVPHVCYCHAPARYLWGQREAYGGLMGAGLGVLGPGLRAWDRKTAANVTQFVANSAHIAREIERCYGREAVVVHPPVRTEFFTPNLGLEREDAWLVAGALEPYKRTDLAILAAEKAGKRLFIAGDGSERKRLRAMAGPHVTFLGRVSDHELRELFRRAQVLIFPQVEDFGILALEAQACGCPVVAQAKGGALETVIDGRTGAFFTDPTPEAVVEAAARVPQRATMACRENAERFSEARFDEGIRRVLQREVG